MGQLQIDVLGTSFAIQSSEDDTYLKKLLKYYRQITEQIQRSGATDTSIQASILAGITLCDELYKEKSKKAIEKSVDEQTKILEEEENQKIEESVIRMIEKIDKAIK